MALVYDGNPATRPFIPASCEKAPSFLYFSIIYSAAEVVMKNNKTFKYVMYVTLVHCLTCFLCGVIFSNLLRYDYWWQQPGVSDYFRDYGGTANASSYSLTDGTALVLSDKDQKWLGINQTDFSF